MRKDVALKSLGVLLLFILLSYLYLYPGSRYLLEGRDDIFLSDGTDSITQTHQFTLVLQEFKNNPSRLFYGAVYSPSLNSPEGFAVWNTWPERFFAILASPFIPLEQLPTALSVFLLLVTGISFVALGRFLKWPWAITLGLAIAWTFSAYTRARAKVHIGFLALYFLPLIFLALWILHKGRSKRSVIVAATLLLAAATTAQYYLVMMAFLIPFPLFIYFYIEWGQRSFIKSFVRLSLSGLPAAFFCGYLLTFSIPTEMKAKISPLPTTGITTEAVHPFLELFAARPLDYFTGDTGVSLSDLNPLRETLNEYNFESDPEGNAHERTNGIRWVIWFLAFVLLTFNFRTQNRLSDPKSLIIGGTFAAMGVVAFLLSLPPSYFNGHSPSTLLNSILPQFRVSSRAGIFVHFSLLMIVGIWFSDYAKRIKYPKWLWIFPFLILIDLPPLYNEMPSTMIPARFETLQNRSYSQCGYGLFFPTISASVLTLDYYNGLSQMRGSGCGIFNSADTSLRERKLFELFPPSPQLIDALQKNEPHLQERFKDFARCLNLRYIVFGTVVPLEWQRRNCEALNGDLDNQGVCFRDQVSTLAPRDPDSCF